jgi:hypothetical protein
MKKLVYILLFIAITIILLSEINSWNISNSTAKKRICKIKRDKIMQRLQSYILSSEKDLSMDMIENEFRKIVRESELICPSGGVYTIFFDNESPLSPSVKCSIHK